MSGKPVLNEKFIRAIADIVWDAVSEGYGVDFSKIDYDSPDYDMLAALRRNSYEFGTFKANAFGNDLYSLLVDKNTNKIRSFSEFKKLASQLNTSYNRHHLKTEYDHAVASGRMAGKWNRYTAGGKDPILMYRTVGDSLVRQDHAKLDRIKRRSSDEFWNWAYPPLGWRCRCSVSRKLEKEGETKNLPSDLPELDPVFRTNTAKSGVIFPEGHPYFRRVSGRAKKDLDERAKRLANQELGWYPARSIKEAEAFALEKGLAKEVKYSGLDLEAVNSTNKTLFLIKERFGLGYDKIKTVKKTGRKATITAASNRAILEGDTVTSQELHINTNFFSAYKNKAEIDASILAENKRNWWVARRYEDIITHEVGHFLTVENTYKVPSSLAKLMRVKDPGKLSIYGTTSLDESMAEIFSLYMRENGNIDKELINLFNKYSKIQLK
jgi:hypothetical protein